MDASMQAVRMLPSAPHARAAVERVAGRPSTEPTRSDSGNKLKAVARLVLAFSLSMVAPASGAAEKLKVVASFSIIGDFARQVGGDRIELRTLVGPNGDAHVYEPKPADAIALTRANVVLVNGLLFEGFLARLLAASGTSAPVVEVTRGAEILRDPAGGHYHYHQGKAVFHEAPFDPHAWQSVSNAKIYVGNIVKAFCAADAAGCAEYSANARSYIEKLSKLDAEAKTAIGAIPKEKRVVVVAHNAFRYFGNAYGLTFLSPQGVSTEAQASAGHVADIIRDIRRERAAAVFAENISDPRLVTQIAREAGLPLGGVLYSDALSEPDGPAPTYVEMQRRNIETITKAVLGQQSSPISR